jgi:predicted nucleotidyltransferase
MGYVDEAFAKARTALEITKTEQEAAARRHKEIRAVVREKWSLEDDFLTGSYRRGTKTKKLKDVDIFVVIDPDGDQADLRRQAPSQILAALKAVLEQRYDDVTADGFACVVRFGPDEEVASFDVVPAFSRSGGGYEIPDAERGRWIPTDPKIHHEESTAMNERCGGSYVPFVKLLKGMNREAGEPIEPSFLLEVMALKLIRTPFERYQDELNWFLATAAERVTEDWPDPAGIGPDVNETQGAARRRTAAETLAGWQRVAEEAVRLEDGGEERAAYEKWRSLFGARMPRP